MGDTVTNNYTPGEYIPVELKLPVSQSRVSQITRVYTVAASPAWPKNVAVSMLGCRADRAKCP